MNVVMLLYPRLTQLDLTGPFEVLSRFKELTIHLAWKDEGPVTDGAGLRLLPSVSFADCPQADILFVPGGPGQLALMEDAEVLEFLRRQAAGAHYITSVCTGSLVLAAAGLLTGYRATCHWLSLDQLGYFGVEPVAERVVVDRNRVTGAGVTSAGPCAEARASSAGTLAGLPDGWAAADRAFSPGEGSVSTTASSTSTAAAAATTAGGGSGGAPADVLAGVEASSRASTSWPSLSPGVRHSKASSRPVTGEIGAQRSAT